MKLVLGMEVGLSPGDFVLDGDPAPLPPKGGGDSSQIFGPFLFWPNGWMHQDATWYRGRPVPGDFVLDGDLAPSQKGGVAPPQKKGENSAHVYCGQTVVWIKMPLGTKVGLIPGDCVLDGDLAPSLQRGWSPLPNFWRISIVAKRLDASRCHLVWR